MADDLVQGSVKGLSARESAMVSFAETLTRQPQSMGQRDITSLRDQGLTDLEIHDLVQVIGYFAYVNRIVLGLGAELGEGEGPIGEWPVGKVETSKRRKEKAAVGQVERSDT